MNILQTSVHVYVKHRFVIIHVTDLKFETNQYALAIDTNKKNIIMQVLRKSIDFNTNNCQLKQKKMEGSRF